MRLSPAEMREVLKLARIEAVTMPEPPAEPNDEPEYDPEDVSPDGPEFIHDYDPPWI